MVHQNDFVRGHSFIIEPVVAQQVLVAQFFHRRIVHNAQKIRQNRFVYLLRKSLSLGNIFLTVAFRAVSEHFVKENRSRSSRQECRAHTWLIERSLDQSFHFLAQRRACCGHIFVAGRVLLINPVEIVVTLDVHAIGRFALNK